jgi:uncharacterized protein (TIGR00369 family)
MTADIAPPRRSADEQARLESELRALFEQQISFNRELGLKILAFDPTAPRIRLEMRPALVGHASSGRIHGGVTAAMLDAIAGFALMTAIGEKFADETAAQVLHRVARMSTIDLRIDYLRPGTGRFFVASAQVTRLGGRIGSVQMALHADDGTRVATGAASFIVS